MKPHFIVCLIAFSMLPAFGAPRADTASVERTLMQMEREFAQANMKNDTATIDRILADDFDSIDYEGNSLSKAGYIGDIKSGGSRTQSFKMGPMKVRIFGDTAVVIGSYEEKSTYKFKDTSGKYSFTDVWVKRGGDWQIVAEQTTASK